MAEQTRVKNITAQEKYLEELKDTEAYKLLEYAYLHRHINLDTEFAAVIAQFLDTGIVDSIYGRRFYLGR